MSCTCAWRYVNGQWERWVAWHCLKHDLGRDNDWIKVTMEPPRAMSYPRWRKW